MGDGTNSSTNHPTTATSGGASAKPTPANNAGGGSGWGDQGFIKGGTTDNKNAELGHEAVCGCVCHYSQIGLGHGADA